MIADAPADGFDPSAGVALEPDIAGELEPIQPPGTPAATPKRRGRKPLSITPEQRKERRRQQERARRARKRALDAARTAAGGSAPAAAGIAGSSDAGDALEHGDGQARQEQPIEREQLETLLGLTAYAVLAPLPRKYGGGELTEEERKLLGGVWAAALIPYMSGTASVMGIALVTSAQVLAVRAVRYRSEIAERAPTPTRDERTDDAAPPSVPPTADTPPGFNL